MAAEKIGAEGWLIIHLWSAALRFKSVLWNLAGQIFQSLTGYKTGGNRYKDARHATDL
jgi:hypothetical protein